MSSTTRTSKLTPHAVTDEDALNRICAIINRDTTAADARAAVAQIIASTGRPVLPVCQITARVEPGEYELPCAIVDTGVQGVTVTVHQSLIRSTGINIEIDTDSDAELETLTVQLNDGLIFGKEQHTN
ncbi:hypothetical protein Lfu02_15210 [Longispora fulva]|uniref:Uncharacterized protein n=1 Tax=Longispora fulva TaxID=619741 RepID=A0A8J7GJF8_9ACTN|nr:hypothetical protein [Longispora fulva]MBG6140469.1 hypothetical protein [Longispora fulva]GIG57149.1 hypothetical protein Lfu02_15210 [Longispora fulva]